MRHYNLFKTANQSAEEAKEVQSKSTDMENTNEYVDLKEEISEIKVGIVTNCRKLNVREEPKLDAPVICEVACQTELIIEEADSTEDFYKVCTAAGIEGFCMKKFIAIQP